MILKLVRSILLLCLSFQLPIFSYISHATIWKRWNAKLNAYNYVITCGDCHVNYDPENNDMIKKQLQAVKGLIQNADNSTMFLVEDANYYTGDNQYIKTRLPSTKNSYQNDLSDTPDSILSGLTEYALKSSKEIKNLECRFYVNLADSVFSHENLESGKSKDLLKISCQEVIKNFDEAKEKHIKLKLDKNLQDLKCYEYFYNKMLEASEEVRENAKLVFQDDFSFENYMKNKSEQFLKMIKSIYSGCFRLIDLNAIEKIISNVDKKKMFIFTGGAHTYNIDLFLEQIGYSKVEEHGQMAFKERYDGQPIFGSNLFSKGKYEEEDPKNVDMTKFIASCRDIKPIDLAKLFRSNN